MKSVLSQYLQQEHAEEVLLFYEAMQNLRLIGHSSPNFIRRDDEMFRIWHDIMSEFINPGCPNPINIPHHLVLQLVQFENINTSRVPKAEIISTLSRAEKEVKSILSGIFQRFESSSLFIDFLKSSSSSKRLSFSLRKSSTSYRTTMSLLLYATASLFTTVVANIQGRHGYIVTVVYDVTQAHKLLHEHFYNVVLVDDSLPGDDLSGVPSLVSSSKNTGGEKYLFMMGDKSKWKESNAIEAGYAGIVRKPFNHLNFERSKANSIVEREYLLSSANELANP